MQKEASKKSKRSRHFRNGGTKKVGEHKKRKPPETGSLELELEEAARVAVVVRVVEEVKVVGEEVMPLKGADVVEARRRPRIHSNEVQLL